MRKGMETKLCVEDITYLELKKKLQGRQDSCTFGWINLLEH